MSEFFPQSIIAGDYMFLSGTPGLNPDSGKIISDNFEEQARQCFENIKIILEEAGSNMSKLFLRQQSLWLPVMILAL